MLRQTLAEQDIQWLKRGGPDQDVVLRTKGALSRNMADFPFPAQCNDYERGAAMERIVQALELDDAAGSYLREDVREFSDADAQVLVERHLMTDSMTYAPSPACIYIAADQSTSYMLNENDHLRCHVVAAGLAIQDVWGRLDRVDANVSAALDPAFHEKWGYLTASLDMVGTGMRIGALLHLPGLAMAGRVPAIEQRAREEKHVFRGAFGSSRDGHGDLYWLCNGATLGQSEEELTFHLRQAVNNIVTEERKMRQQFLEEARITLEDRVGRALGVARNGRLIEFEEGLSLLSSLRLGAALELIDAPDLVAINRVLLESAPGHMDLKSGEASDGVTQNVARADLFRRRF
jgi:protein arginine kinase